MEILYPPCLPRKNKKPNKQLCCFGRYNTKEQNHYIHSYALPREITKSSDIGPKCPGPYCLATFYMKTPSLMRYNHSDDNSVKEKYFAK